MSKGRIDIDTVFYIVLGLAVLVGIISVLSGAVPIGDFIQDMIKKVIGMVSTETPESLRSAIECAYYRCYGDEGCESDEVEYISWKDSEGNEFNCKEDFCNEEWQDSGHRICTPDNALQYPVEFNYLEAEETRVSKEYLNSDMNFACIFSQEDMGLPIGVQISPRLNNFLVIKDDVIVDIKFTGSGCMISQAAAAMLLERVKGQSVAFAQSITVNDMSVMLGIELGFLRKQCAELPLIILLEALK